MKLNPHTFTELLFQYASLPKVHHELVNGKIKVVRKPQLPRPYRIGMGKMAKGKVINPK